MALDQLKVYNAALQLIGERRLNTLTDDVETRYELEAIWDLDPANYCAELVKPRFACKVEQLASPSATTAHSLQYTHSLPSNFVDLVGLYSDAELDQPINRFIREGQSIASDYETMYIRFIDSSLLATLTNWSPSFTRVVVAYIASELAERIVSDVKDVVFAQFQERTQNAITLDGFKEPTNRAKASSATLTESWLRIYNDALLILGSDQITEVTDDSNRRSILDVAINSDLVATVLEDIGWHWAITSQKLTFDPSLEPEWGYRYAYRLPTDLHRFDGIWADEYFQNPIKRYSDENGILFCEYQEIYIQYVSDSFATNPSEWKPSFRRYIAAVLADNVKTNPEFSSSNIQNVVMTLDKRKRETLAIDAQSSPPRLLTAGSWVRSRTSHRPSRGRP